MSYFKFQDKRIEKAFKRVAKHEGNDKRIDDKDEKQAISNILSGCDAHLTKFDRALLKSGSLDFDNKDIKKAYDTIAGGNGNKFFDTDNEMIAAEKFFNENKDNMTENDYSLFSNMIEAGKDTVINVDIDGENNTVNIFTGSKSIVVKKDSNCYVTSPFVQDNPIAKKEEQFFTEKTIVDKPIEKPIENKTPIEEKPTKNKTHTVRIGDNWYKVVQENYNVSSHSEIMKIVRQLKKDYFKNNEAKLRAKGFISDRGGFFPGVNKNLELPQTIIVDGKPVSLR